MGFFFKQKTEYEMRISDGSSDVCSSDLTVKLAGPRCARRERHRDCRGDAVPGDCRHQCAREAGLAAAARCRNDEEKDPKRVVEGKSVSVRVDLGGGWVMKTI